MPAIVSHTPSASIGMAPAAHQGLRLTSSTLATPPRIAGLPAMPDTAHRSRDRRLLITTEAQGDGAHSSFAVMPQYRMRPQILEAMQFDGTSAGVERVGAWISVVAPEIRVRPRTEYRGWDDLTGYLELEVRDLEHGLMGGDWLVISEVEGRKTPWLVDADTFRKYYEEIPLHIDAPGTAQP